ncbi:MAG: hypothetical protein LBU23_03210, partial [Planctomycetota bacterium]|nr:hypothetical protein [Planctomycetota bacterium]
MKIGKAPGGTGSPERFWFAPGVALILLAGCFPPGRAGAADSGQSLKDALNQAAAGSVVEVGAGAAIDLNGLAVVVTNQDVTLRGSGGPDLGTSIAAGAAAMTGDPGQEALAGNLSGLVAKLKADLPNSRIYNSDPQGYRSGLVLDTNLAADERLVILTSGHALWGANAIYGGNPDFNAIVSAATADRPAPVTIQKIDTTAGRANYYQAADVISSRTAAAYYDRDNLDNGGKGGISAPTGGFSLKNLTFSGTEANIAGRPIGATGASVVYTGLAGSNLARDTSLASSGMGTVENVAFIDNVVNVAGDAHVVGNSLFFTNRHYPGTIYAWVPNGRGGNGEGGFSSYFETLDSITGSVFIGNRILADMEGSVGSRDIGAGAAGWADIETVRSSLFAENLNRGHHGFGGGLFARELGSLSDSIFHNNLVESDHEAMGGGVFAEGGSGIGSITGGVFVGNEVRTLAVHGDDGGAAGGAVSSGSGVGGVENSLFAYNRAYNDTGDNAEGDSLGGALNVGGKLDRIAESVFLGNYAGAEKAEAAGGAINLAAKAITSTEIVNSQFLDNRVYSGTGDGKGGALYIASAANAAGYELKLLAGAGGVTRFSGNTVNGEANGIWIETADRDVNLTVDAEAGGLVALDDPIKVELAGSGAFALAVNGAGEFVWGGENVIDAAGGGTVAFAGGGNAILAADFGLASSAGNIGVTFEGANLTLALSGRDAGRAFFRSGAISLIDGTGATVRAEYFSFEDSVTGDWKLADLDIAGLVGGTLYNPATGTTTRIDILDNGRTLRLTYQGPTAAF